MVTIHVFAVLFSLAIVFIADKEALSWMRGKQQLMSERRVRILHTLTWAGLCTLLVSGVILAFPMLNYLLTQPLFIMKMLFVAVLFVNAVLIGKLSAYAVREPFAALSSHDRMRLVTSGAVSSFSWIAAMILALLVFK